MGNPCFYIGNVATLDSLAASSSRIVYHRLPPFRGWPLYPALWLVLFYCYLKRSFAPQTLEELLILTPLTDVDYEPVMFRAAPNGSSLEFVFGTYSMRVAMR